MRSDIFKRLLYVATYVYLVLPYLVFFGGWVRQPYSTLFILLLSGALFFGLKISKGMFLSEPRTHVSYRTVALVVLPVIVVALVAGAGGWGFQDTDWLKHNAILRDLITEPWPVIYEAEGKRVMLTYYTAYQLPAALVGKLLGWEAANHALFLYTVIGLCLSTLWVWLITEVKWWFAVVFLAFSGMDMIGQLVLTVSQEPTIVGGLRSLSYKVRALEHLEWWAGWGFAQFSSNAALIVWVPNQAIAGWLLTSLVLNDAKVRWLHRTALLYLGLCTLWTPFVTLGLIPFVFVLVFCEWRERHFSHDMWQGLVSWPNGTGLLIGIFVAIYLAGRFEAYALPIDLGVNIYKERITWTFLRLPDHFVAKYIRFIVLEFAVLNVLLYLYLVLQKGPQFTALRNLLLLSSGILFALPFLNWGWNNEPAMRTSIPALFVTALIAIRLLSDPPRSSQAVWIRRAIAGVLIVGSTNAAVELGRHVAGVYRHQALVSVPEITEVRTLFQLQHERYRKYYNFVGQYVGSAESFFARHLAKR